MNKQIDLNDEEMKLYKQLINLAKRQNERKKDQGIDHNIIRFQPTFTLVKVIDNGIFTHYYQQCFLIFREQLSYQAQHFIIKAYSRQFGFEWVNSQFKNIAEAETYIAENFQRVKF